MPWVQVIRPTLSWTAVPGALRYRVAGGDRCGLRQHRVRPDRGSHQRGDQCAVGQHCLLLARAGHQPLRKRRGSRPTSSSPPGTPGSCPAGTTANQVCSSTTIRLPRSSGPRRSAWAPTLGCGRQPPETGMSSTVWRANNVSTAPSDQPLISPAIVLPSAAQSPLQLTFRSFHVFRDRRHYRLLGRRSVGHQHRQRRSWQPLNSQLLTDPYDGHQLGRHQSCRWRCADVVSVRRRRAQLSGRPQRLWG
jgi:hypothetical protein